MNGEVKRVTDTGSATNIGGFVGLNTGEIKNSYVKATISNSSSAYSVGGFAAINQGSIADSVWSADSLGSSASGIGNSSTGTSTNLTNVAASDFDAPYYESHVYEKLISAGTLFINNVEITLSNSSISDAIAQINAQSAKTGVVASIEDKKVILKNTDGSTKTITIGEGTSNFVDITGVRTERLSEAKAKELCYTIIKTAQDLQNMKNNLTGKYILMNDIDLSGIANWTPIGTEADSFKGIFDGNGFVIKNLTIDSNSENVGLFGHTTLATIKNVGLENVNIKAGAGTSESQINVGAFVGTATSTTLSNVYVTGTIAGVNTDTNDIYAGGLVGNLNVYSSIINSYSKCRCFMFYIRRACWRSTRPHFNFKIICRWQCTWLFDCRRARRYKKKCCLKCNI